MGSAALSSTIHGMDDVRAGRVLRALRRRLRWSQRQLAERSGLSQQQVSLIERGHVVRMQVGTVRLAFGAVDASTGWDVRWRGGALDRLLDERHAALVGAIADLLTTLGWAVVPEVTYSVFGERGSIDLAGWEAGTGTLLVVEVKSELTGIESTLRKHDEKARLGAHVVRSQFSWDVKAVARLLVLSDDSNLSPTGRACGRSARPPVPAPRLGRPPVVAGPCRTWRRPPVSVTHNRETYESAARGSKGRESPRLRPNRRHLLVREVAGSTDASFC